jgi:hypothetical protein
MEVDAVVVVVDMEVEVVEVVEEVVVEVNNNNCNQFM